MAAEGLAKKSSVLPPDRAPVSAETDSPVGFPAETRHLFFHVLRLLA
jgi:hypothetical protein